MSTAESPETLDGGSYEVIRRRLLEQAAELATKAETLNARRKEVFGGTELALLANERVRTSNNCIPRDVVSVDGHLLLGFEVFLGLRQETGVGDVLSLHKFQKTAEGYDLEAVPLTAGGAGAFLADPAFVKDFRDAFRYMKDARLAQLLRTDTRLLAVVQVGASARDIKAFRWALDAKGRLTYMDPRGDEDYVLPRQHDFVWTQTTRENQVPGLYPHVSILDQVFVETIGGDLTIKVENNTREGRGIYSEPVVDPNQTLDDADIAYAKVGSLILLRVHPFREESSRYLVFDVRTKRVQRIDAIGQACLELPEDHGIVFPGGFCLQSGEIKLFEGDTLGMQFERVLPSPNGEDVLYVFYRATDGQYILCPYNAIRKEIASPLRCHGYSLFSDGTMALLRASAEPTRVHPIQIWRTPFVSAEHAATAPTGGSYLAKVGNAELVRGISEALGLRRLAVTESPTRATYEEVAAGAARMVDAFYWLGHAEAENLVSTVQALRKTSELILDEFDKALAVRKRADEAIAAAGKAQKDLLASTHPDSLTNIEAFLAALTSLRKQRGQLIALKELPGVDLLRIEAFEREVTEAQDAVGRACVTFLLRQEAFQSLGTRLTELAAQCEGATKATELQPFGKTLEELEAGLSLLTEIVGNLAIDDTTVRTQVLEGVSATYAQLNAARATYQAKKRDLGAREGRTEFAVQFKLLGQSVTAQLASCDTPERCDEALTKLLLQLEELEGRFGEFDTFVSDLLTKRQEVSDAIGARRQQLVDERQRRAQSLATAADRILQSITRKARTLATSEELHAYFAADAMVHKLGELERSLTELGDSVRAEEVASRLKATRQNALRALRDRTELFEGDEGILKLGSHRFRVQTQPLELVLLARDGALAVHLTGTDFYERLGDAELDAVRELWEQSLVSESPEVYRGEFLAASMFFDAETARAGLDFPTLETAVRDGNLTARVRAYAEERLDEGYERGVHDVDAAAILGHLLALRSGAGLLRFASATRALGVLYWSERPSEERELVHRRARSVGRVRTDLGDSGPQRALAQELEAGLRAFALEKQLEALGAKE
ncbi:MAG: DNA repair ATPase, partial [Myxococcales bacterium]